MRLVTARRPEGGVAVEGKLSPPPGAAPTALSAGMPVPATVRDRQPGARADGAEDGPTPVAALAPGDLLGGRHRLQRLVTSGIASSLWRAVDEVLARAVAVRVLAVDDEGGTRRFLAAAIHAGRVSHPRVARVYDATLADGHAIVVSEWVDGTPLTTLLADGALSARQATSVTHQLADGLATAHAAGVFHRRLLPGDVLVCEDGGVKLTDLETAAVVAQLATAHQPPQDPVTGPTNDRAGDPADHRGTHPAYDMSSDPADEQAAESADVRALGALLYAMLTGRWPLDLDVGLPPAPRSDGRLCTPRQVRAGVPGVLDATATRILDPGRRPTLPPLTRAEAVAAALAPLPGPPTPQRGREPVRKPPPPPRHRHRWVIRLGLTVIILLGVGVAGWVAGLQVGQLPGAKTALPLLPAKPKRAQPGQSPAPPALLPLARVTSFDPPPGDGAESPSFVDAAHDNDTSTAWETDVYYGSPSFGGLKPGVGLLVDLGHPTAVGSVRLTLTKPGASVELRAQTNGADTAGATSGEFTVVDRADNVHTEQTLTPNRPTTARYWLVWLTRLTPDGGGFREGIAEMAFLPR